MYFSSVFRVIHNAWHYSLISIDGREVVVSNILVAFAVLLLSIRYIPRIKYIIHNYIYNNMFCDKDTAHMLERVLIYVIICVDVIIILEISNIPFKIFTFIGGAAALGVGLGMQTVMNNFISSLIIMIERPIKIDDIIEINGVIGNVSSIGMRCVIVTTFNNANILIPNSKLMQDTLTNWTLENNIICCRVEVFVIKNRDVRFITNILNTLKSMLDEAEYILDKTKSTVYLTQINKDDVIFLLSFYCDVRVIAQYEYIKNNINLHLLSNIDNILEIKFLPITSCPCVSA